MEPWLSFYKPHFPSQLAAEQFVEACENLEPSGANHVVKIMMHQAQRLISIVDDLPRFRPHQEPFPVLFLLMCVENISKLHDGFSGEGKSRHYVQTFLRRFFQKQIKTPLLLALRLTQTGCHISDSVKLQIYSMTSAVTQFMRETLPTLHFTTDRCQCSILTLM